MKNITKEGVKVDLKIQNPDAWAVNIESSETVIFYRDEIRLDAKSIETLL